MEWISTFVFSPRSYVCSYRERWQKREFALPVTRVWMTSSNIVVLEAVTARHVHRGLVLRLFFLQAQLAVISVQQSPEGIYCAFSLQEAVSILVAYYPKQLSSCGKNEREEGAERADNNDDVVQKLSPLLRDVVAQELKRGWEERKLVKLQANIETQTRIINTQKRLVASRRQEFEPIIREHFPALLDRLLDTGKLSPEVYEHLTVVWELLQLPLVPITSEDFLDKHGRWMKRTELNVLTLGDKLLLERTMDVTLETSTKKTVVLSNKKLRIFALNTFRMASGSKHFFVTLSKQDPQPIVGEFVRGVDGEIIEARSLPATERVSDWFTFFSKVILGRTAPGIVQNFTSALVAGTAYMLIQELSLLQQP